MLAGLATISEFDSGSTGVLARTDKFSVSRQVPAEWS